MLHGREEAEDRWNRDFLDMKCQTERRRLASEPESGKTPCEHMEHGTIAQTGVHDTSHHDCKAASSWRQEVATKVLHCGRTRTRDTPSPEVDIDCH